MISRAQLISSSGVLVRFLRAQMSRWAQHASIVSRPASLSTPRIRNGPTFARGSGAKSNVTGNGGGRRLMIIPPSACRLALAGRYERKAASGGREKFVILIPMATVGEQ